MTAATTLKKLRLREVKSLAQVPQLGSGRRGSPIQACPIPEPMFSPLCLQRFSLMEICQCTLGGGGSPPFGEIPDGGWRAGLAGRGVGNRSQESPGIPDRSLPQVPRYKQTASDSSTAPVHITQPHRRAGQSWGHVHTHTYMHSLTPWLGSVGRALAWSDEAGDAGRGLLTLDSRQPS